MPEQYDGFISYSHAADDLLAPRLQAGLQRFAKPWWKRRALRVFRDESSLAANPHLWSSIVEALDSSGWFVLLLSEDAARSEWVGKEIEHWVANHDVSRILPVVTDGEFGWADGDVVGSSVPQALQGVFVEEPRWVDLRWARTDEHLDLSNPLFSDAVADIASALRGIPKDELASEEVRQHRRTIRTAWAAGVVVVLLGIAATVGAVVAVGQSNEAQDQRDEAQRQAEIADQQRSVAEQQTAIAETERQNAVDAQAEAEAQREVAEVERDRADESAEEASRQATFARSQELWASAALALESDPALAALLGVAAVDVAGSTDRLGASEVDVLWKALREDRALLEIDHGNSGESYLALSADGSLLAVSSVSGARVTAYDAPNGERLWEYAPDTSDSFAFVWIHPDASRVAVGIRDSASGLSVREGVEPDDLPNRVVVLDGADGTVVHTIEFEGCVSVDAQGWSDDGEYFLLSSGGESFQPCVRDGVTEETWVEVLDGDSMESIAVIAAGGGSIPVMDDANRLFVFHLDESVAILEPPTFTERRVIEGSAGLGDVSPDGSLIVSESFEQAVRIFDVSSGQQVDLLGDLREIAARPLGVSFSPDGSQVVAATIADEVIVWSVSDGQELLRLPGGPGTNTAMTADGSVLYSAHADGVVRAWDMTASSAGTTTLADLGDHDWVNGRFRIGPALGVFTNLNLAAPDQDPLARFFDLETGEIVATQPGWPRGWLADGRLLLERDWEWHVYDPSTGATTYLVGCATVGEVCVDSGEPSEFWFLWTTIDGSEILGSRFPWEEMHVIDPDSGALVSTESTHDLRFGVAATSDAWFMGWSSNELVAVERGSGEVLYRSKHPPAVQQVSNALDRLAIWFGGEPRVTLIDFETWESVDLQVQADRIRGLAFSPDDAALAVATPDNVLFYDVATGDLALSVPIDGVSDLHYLSDDAVVVGTATGQWMSISLDPADLVASVRSELRRSFTAEECVRYRIDPCPTLEQIKSRG